MDYLRAQCRLPLGHSQNPDIIDRELCQSGRLDLSAWGLQPSESSLRSFLSNHPLWGGEAVEDAVSVEGSVVVVALPFRQGYMAAILCDFMRHQWLATGQMFTFETVMSSGDKVQLLDDARQRGYRTYLYYVCTDSFLINRERVASRVAQGGHGVPSEKIESRYARSLSLLPQAIARSNRAYLFDNSGQSHHLVAEFSDGRVLAASAELPEWLQGILPGRT